MQEDRKDSCAVGWDHKERVDKHESQKDYAKGFGGKFGLQEDRKDKVRLDVEAIFIHKNKRKPNHAAFDIAPKSSSYFNRNFYFDISQSALGWDHHEKTEKHSSQVDHSKGFGGKFGVQEDRKDRSALGWEHRERVSLDHIESKRFASSSSCSIVIHSSILVFIYSFAYCAQYSLSLS